jgi:putative membrane protein
MTQPSDETTHTQARAKLLPRLALRGGMGGFLMGLANLVPGISGGTMLVAAGVYRRFIAAVAEISTFRFRLDSLVLLTAVAGAAAVAILSLAGPVKDLVVYHRWVMYSIFIGLTLGGVPVILSMLGKTRPSVWIGAAAGLVAMVALAMIQAMGVGAGGHVQSVPVFLLAGMLAAGAMILPGVSGGYLMLVLGVYVPVLSAVDALSQARKGWDFQAMRGPALEVVLPVGIGVLVGIVAVSNVLKILLRKYEKATLGVLLGLLIGAVVGLWPFQEGRAPQIGETFKGRPVTQEVLEEIEPEDYPTAYFPPKLWQIPAALGLMVGGFGITALIARLGKQRTSDPDVRTP